jgi:hypothetical protein
MSVGPNVLFALGLGDLNPLHWLGRGISNFGLSLITPWVLDGTKAALEEVARVISAATSPNVTSGWFTGEYWRVAALASMLTLPFIFAAALQALLRSEPGLIFKVVFGYLPLAMIGISIASPVVMLMLSATNEMCSIVSGTGVGGGAKFLNAVALKLAANSALGGSPFFAVIVGLFTLFAALMLTLELLIREASVYIVVLMLPLAFAAMVWPARRIWAIRLVELLTSLILAKFVIVSVLSLAGAALGNGGVSPMLTAMTLVMLSTLAPWALMRLLPFTEVAAAAAGTLRQESGRPMQNASAAAQNLLGEGSDPAEAVARRIAGDQTRSDLFGGEVGGSRSPEGDYGSGDRSGPLDGVRAFPTRSDPTSTPSGSGEHIPDSDGAPNTGDEPPWSGTDINPRLYKPNMSAEPWDYTAGSDAQVQEATTLGRENDSAPITPPATGSDSIFGDRDADDGGESEKQ